MDFFQGTQEQVRTSHGKRAISVRATESLLYFRISIKPLGAPNAFKKRQSYYMEASPRHSHDLQTLRPDVLHNIL